MASQVVERMGTTYAMTHCGGFPAVTSGLSTSAAATPRACYNLTFVSTSLAAQPGRVVVGLGSSSSSAAAVPGYGRRSRGPVGCKSSLRPLSDSDGNVAEFHDEEEFNKILTEAGEKLIVVDISTTTCGPCKMIFPKLVEMSLAYPDVVFLKINGDTNNSTRSLMRKWGVRAVPNFRFFKNGELVHSHTGAKLDELKKRFAEHYGQPINV